MCGIVMCGIVMNGIVMCGIVMCGIVMCGIVPYVSSFIERSENIFHLVLYLVADSRCYTGNYRLNEEEFGNRIQSSINIGVRNRFSLLLVSLRLLFLVSLRLFFLVSLRLLRLALPGFHGGFSQ
jgi:hypothetical protein